MSMVKISSKHGEMAKISEIANIRIMARKGIIMKYRHANMASKEKRNNLESAAKAKKENIEISGGRLMAKIYEGDRKCNEGNEIYQ